MHHTRTVLLFAPVFILAFVFQSHEANDSTDNEYSLPNVALESTELHSVIKKGWKSLYEENKFPRGDGRSDPLKSQIHLSIVHQSHPSTAGTDHRSPVRNELAFFHVSDRMDLHLSNLPTVHHSHPSKNLHAPNNGGGMCPYLGNVGFLSSLSILSLTVSQHRRTPSCSRHPVDPTLYD